MNAADAAKALEAKKGAEIDGRVANVDFSTPRQTTDDGDRSQKRANTYGDATSPEADTLFVANLSFDVDEDVLGEEFGRYGTVTQVRLPTDM